MSKVMRPKTPFEFCVYPALKKALSFSGDARGGNDRV